MDEIWVLTEEQKDACCKSGVKVPINIVRPARDFRFFDKKRDPIIFPSIIDDTYKFYTIGDASYRKNLFGLINTFLSEFSFDDNVSLVIKSFMEGKTHAEAASYVENAVKEIKDSLRKPEWSYPKIVFLEKRFSDEEMCSLHQSCDCFVSSSRGEGDGMPALDAACFGNITITPSWNGTRETFESTNHISIKNLLEKTVVFPNQPLANLYNPDETWFEPSSKEIALAMREVYENPDKYKKIAQEEILNLESRFSLEESGRVMGNLLKNG
jgi:glycosyltransferase involved in cell wall biosynthesis